MFLTKPKGNGRAERATLKQQEAACAHHAWDWTAELYREACTGQVTTGGAVTQPPLASAEISPPLWSHLQSPFQTHEACKITCFLSFISFCLRQVTGFCFRTQMQTYGLKKQYWCNLHFLLFLRLSWPTTHITRSSLVSAAVSYTKGTSENLYGGNNMQFSSWTPFKM